MLDIRRVLASAPQQHKAEKLNPLTTVWGEECDPSDVLSEYPRPRMRRDNVLSLNGMWDYAIVPLSGTSDAKVLREALMQARMPLRWDGKITVPFSPEASLSGVNRTLHPNELLWYRRLVELPELSLQQRFILHFEAVDWMCACFVNGQLVGTHTGSYLPFSFDITDLLGMSKKAEIAVCVYDPSDAGVQLRGKQTLSRGDIWYTAQSGIWQSVWCEVVSAAHLEELTLKGDMHGTLQVRARSTFGPRDAFGLGNEARTDSLTNSLALEVTILDAQKQEVLHATLPVGKTGETCTELSMSSLCLWSPEDPYLYAVTVMLRSGDAVVDVVQSYCAFRTVEVAPDAKGIPRVHLNGKPFFVRGVLDQGYWPDGLMTAPSDEALIYDIETMRAAGFNTLRKHLKIESERWYYHCDRLGMLVWQDCVSGGDVYSSWHTSQKPTLFSFTWRHFQDTTPRYHRALAASDENYKREWIETCRSMVELLDGHPSVGFWTLFNEGWGQFDAQAAVKAVRELDATRPIDATSGWYDQGCGDFISIHNYFRPLRAGWRDIRKARANRRREGAKQRAVIISEFGGLAQMVPKHTSLDHAYGYGNFATADDWCAAVKQELAKAEALQTDGLAGYIYTQLSDVEEEVNGLLTYDRKVNKLDRSTG